MNSDREDPLAAQLTRELRNLPDLTAPDTLIQRVLVALESRCRRPWYRSSWQAWPLHWQCASLLVLLCLVGGVCAAGWRFTHTGSASLHYQRLEDLCSLISAFDSALNALAGSAVLVLKQLGVGFAIACVFGIGLAYALCLGLGTIYVRIAMAASAPFKRE